MVRCFIILQHGYGELVHTLVVASSEGVGQGRCCRVLNNSMIWQRNIFLVNSTIYFILLFYCLFIAANMME
jgi:hypothetical protein